MATNDHKLQGVVWEFVHDGTNAVPDSGSIAYQNSEVAFSPFFNSGSVAYKNAEIAFSPIFSSASIAYQNAEVAFSLVQNSGSISYQNTEIAFHPLIPSASIGYQAVEVAFREIIPSASIGYESVEVAFSLVGQGLLYGSITEVGWRFDNSTWPPEPPAPPQACGVLVNPDFSINTYGLRTLSCERVKAAGVDQVPFRLAHQTDLGLRRLALAAAEGGATLYGSIVEVGWVYTP